MWGALVGYAAGYIGHWFLPLFAAMLFPAIGAMIGSGLQRFADKRSKSKHNIPDVLPEQQEDGNGRTPPKVTRTAKYTRVAGEDREENDGNAGNVGNAGNADRQPAGQAGGEAREAIDPIFQPVVEYLGILEDMVISEGQKNQLDSEIVEKSCALFLRLQRVIPLLSGLNNGDINHTVKRLVLNDLNSVIQPFLRLSGEAKIKNRRVLLNGLRDVNSKISSIVATIEHKDLLELQTRAEVIHSRYANS